MIIAFPVVGFQIESSLKRFETVGLLTQGDITVGGTLERLNVMTPLIWLQAKKSLTLGYGFTDNYFEYTDGHVAHLNILLQSGIISTIILNFIFFCMFYKIWKISKNKNVISGHGSSVMIFSFGLLGLSVQLSIV